MHSAFFILIALTLSWCCAALPIRADSDLPSVEESSPFNSSSSSVLADNSKELSILAHRRFSYSEIATASDNLSAVPSTATEIPRSDEEPDTDDLAARLFRDVGSPFPGFLDVLPKWYEGTINPRDTRFLARLDFFFFTAEQSDSDLSDSTYRGSSV
ncbi:hypothetical protein EW146_g3801 [Bondarzewia mesenterica]|uniref:Uncharacterized protein n=1 Tax=Bondarzewia mesenterica TaxID=1095465 RepID=A0A4S4LWI6_9AGAM|nr:hypothetical protein EW146_g3801 [Bondarzewia mesenterica]